MHTKLLEAAQLKRDVLLESFSYMVLMGIWAYGIASLTFLIRICTHLYRMDYNRLLSLSSAIRKVSKCGAKFHL